MTIKTIASSISKILVPVMLWQCMSPAAYAQQDNIMATLDCLEEVAHEKIVAHLPVLVSHMRERQRDETGAYPPPPDQMKLDAGMADIGNDVLLLKTAQAVRDIQDIEAQEQAFALLHPLILEAWQGNLPDVSPEQALKACFEAVYYPSLPILPPNRSNMIGCWNSC